MNKNINKIPSITIDDLAVMIKKGFDEVGHRFTEVDKRFDKLERRMDRLEVRFDLMESRFDVFEQKFDNLADVVAKNHSVRIKRVERHLAIS